MAATPTAAPTLMPMMAAVLSPPLLLLEAVAVASPWRTNTMLSPVPWNMMAAVSQLTAAMQGRGG